jgi:hypothetical protein
VKSTEIKKAKTVENVSSESIIDSALLLAVAGCLFFHYHNHPNPPYALSSYFRATNLAHDIYKLARTYSNCLRTDNLWAGLIWDVDLLDFRLQEYSSWMSFE